MKHVEVNEAKAHLSRLIEEAEAGEEIVLSIAGRPAVRLVPVSLSQPVVLGSLKGNLHVPLNFDEPLPAEVLAGFEMGSIER